MTKSVMLLHSHDAAEHILRRDPVLLPPRGVVAFADFGVNIIHSTGFATEVAAAAAVAVVEEDAGEVTAARTVSLPSSATATAASAASADNSGVLAPSTGVDGVRARVGGVEDDVLSRAFPCFLQSPLL